jgi:sn-glycerol 3-phosphate transport system permease protein
MAKFERHKLLGFFFVAPQLVLTLVFFIWPAVSAFIQSFFFADAFGLFKQFAGFKNYFDLLRDPYFFDALWVTLVIAFFVTLATQGLGLLLAVLVNACSRSQGVYKSLFFWPYAVAPAIAAILWRFLCQPSIGWLSTSLEAMGFNFNYLIHPKQALLVIIVAASWQQLSYNFLFYFAALKALPKSLLEAATLDGASHWRRFWQIIFPLLSPTSFFLLIMNLIYSFFDTFGIIDVLTHGGPGSATTNLMYKVYKDGFVNMDLGSSASISVLLMLLVISLSLIQFFYLEKKIHYA